MKVDEALLKRLEKLSNLEISEDKRSEVMGQLEEIVSFVENMGDLDTSHASDTFSMSENGTQLREDSPTCNTAINDAILTNAPHSEDHFFIVQKIIE